MTVVNKIINTFFGENHPDGRPVKGTRVYVNRLCSNRDNDIQWFFDVEDWSTIDDRVEFARRVSPKERYQFILRDGNVEYRRYYKSWNSENNVG